MWTVKHKPESLDEFVGKACVEFIKKWDGKPLIVYGGPGIGKSLIAELIAKENNWDLIEVSDDNIENAVEISSTSSLYGGKKLKNTGTIW